MDETTTRDTDSQPNDRTPAYAKPRVEKLGKLSELIRGSNGTKADADDNCDPSNETLDSTCPPG